jgi:hypothetical protein
MSTGCFFCKAETDELSLVCPACGRDKAIPAPLSAEHQAFLQKRKRLRAELVEAKARLESCRHKPMAREG